MGRWRVEFVKNFFSERIVLLTVIVSFSCSPSREAMLRSKSAGGYNVDKVWEPGYYIYSNGNYKFVRGQYRSLLSRKAHRRRMLQGNCPGDLASRR